MLLAILRVLGVLVASASLFFLGMTSSCYSWDNAAAVFSFSNTASAAGDATGNLRVSNSNSTTSTGQAAASTATPVQVSPPVKASSYFAMCLVVGYQNDDLREWVDYHHLMGASKFYVYDDGAQSSTPASAVLQDLIDSGVVVTIDSSSHPRTQTANYQTCIDDHRHEHQWLGLIDVDEFIVVDDQSQTIPDMLKNYTQYGGVGKLASCLLLVNYLSSLQLRLIKHMLGTCSDVIVSQKCLTRCTACTALLTHLSAHNRFKLGHVWL
jgi:Glycosyltransferase family 92